MLSQENNQILCEVGIGSPCGELFRSVWLPALLSSQLPAPCCPPVRLKLLGEQLVAIRDGAGKIGIIQANCAHRRAPLFFGRMEPSGIRCVYHGWLYNVDGQCLDMPSEPNKELCRRIKLKSYEVREKAGIAWIYMGKKPVPQLPAFPWIDLPASRLYPSVWLQETNWLQGVEGEIDSSHVSTLHKNAEKAKSSRTHRHFTFLDPKAALFVRDTPVGFMSLAKRKAEDSFYWRVTQWMAPMFSLIPSAAWPIGGRAWVPLDDENTYCWDLNYNVDSDISDEFYRFAKEGLGFPPQSAYAPHELNDGTIIDTWIPKRTRDNDYLIDRKLQQDFSMTGIYGSNDQDRAVQEGMGRRVDRSQERLVSADLAIVTARRRLLEIITTPDGLEKFRSTIADGKAFAMEPLDTVSPAADSDTLLAEVGLA